MGVSAARQVFSTVYSCLAGLTVGEPVYLFSTDAVRLADGTDAAKMPCVGLVASKPTSTTCIVQYAGEVPGLSGLVAGSSYYVGAGGALTSSPAGLVVPQIVGVAKNPTTLVSQNLSTSGAVEGDSTIVGDLTVSGTGTFGDFVSVTVSAYGGAGSEQSVAGDMDLAVGAGSADGGNPKFLAGMMGNVLGASLTKDANYLGGVIGHYNVTGVKVTTYPAGAVLAGVGDGVTEADGAVVAYVDGDSATTKAVAAFKVKSNNSTAASGFDFGLDLQDAAHDGYLPVNNAFYKKAQLRLTEDVCVLLKSGVPVDGIAGTGVGTAGPGSMCVDYANANLYLNAGTSGSPLWKLVTRAA